MKIGVIVAMDKEFVQLRGILSGAHEEQVDRNQFVVGDAGGKEVVLQKCGIGKVNAAVGTVEMIHAYHPDIIISTGCAGGADTSLAVTDVVVGTHYVFHDVYCGSEVAYGQMVGMPAEYGGHAGRVYRRCATGGDRPAPRLQGDGAAGTDGERRLVCRFA